MKKRVFWITFFIALGCVSIITLMQPLINSYFGNHTVLPYIILIILLSLCAGLIASMIDKKFNKK
ncbi:hypothetical protein LASUN_01970 [Lentilactobacillus sunkii]|jgi:uncharacterized membrane protein|uniref:Uncharacterized protein n=1 Tax=Lentilactobacillus sunkii TaxID=481719 RepID=A0A1E7XJI6_9LACO|nr:hypothetical protein [Lentilactobacillus sunkii]OFA13198.1 hypothetical protein LASUN_01970 [Lentilactobacillus sunkii]